MPSQFLSGLKIKGQMVAFPGISGTIGMQRRIGPYWDFPPLCVGQQLRAKYLFVGNTTLLLKCCEFLFKLHCTFSSLLTQENMKEKLSSLPNYTELLKLIDEIGPYIEFQEPDIAPIEALRW